MKQRRCETKAEFCEVQKYRLKLQVIFCYGNLYIHKRRLKKSKFLGSKKLFDYHPLSVLKNDLRYVLINPISANLIYVYLVFILSFFALVRLS